jgi:hypothetical protein
MTRRSLDAFHAVTHFGRPLAGHVDADDNAIFVAPQVMQPIPDIKKLAVVDKIE